MVNWKIRQAIVKINVLRRTRRNVGSWNKSIQFCNPTNTEVPDFRFFTFTSTIGGENFGVCKGSENKEACAKFLEWLCSQENEAKWAAVGGKIPTRQDATAEYTFEQDGFKVFTDEMNYAQARGPHAEWPSISEAVYTATQSVIVDGTSAKDALETAAAKINPIVEETPLPESN